MLNLHAFAKLAVKTGQLPMSSQDIFDCINPPYFSDKFLPNEILIQGFEYTLGEGIDFSGSGRKKVIIFCHTLNIVGKFSNPEGVLIIFCKVLNSVNGQIDLSGISASMAGKQPANCDGNSPNAHGADNLRPDGKPYDLQGGDGGNCILYLDEIIGNLEVLVFGGNGGQGESGDDACIGSQGIEGKDDNQCGSNCDGEGGTRGGDGVPPGIGGPGAKGGKAGNGGIVTIFCSSMDVPLIKPDNTASFFQQKTQGKIIANFTAGTVGAGGAGGAGGTHGGLWGPGGRKMRGTYSENDHGGAGCKSCHLQNDRYPFGTDFSTVPGAPGKAGPLGNIGNNGKVVIDLPKDTIVSWIPSSFIRLMLSQAEYLYINDNIKDSTEILNWLISIKLLKDSFKNKPVGEKLSQYLDLENESNFSPYFSLANIYLNQISLGQDFFGNTTDYVTLLDQDYIDYKIMNLKSFIDSSQKLTVDLCNKDIETTTARASINSSKDQNTARINAIKDEITNLSRQSFDLNDEILDRENQLAKYKDSIAQKEQAFRNAVENASHGCSFLNVITTLSSLVAIATGVGAGIGAVGLAMNVVSNINSLKNEFIGKVDSIAPWASPEKWKQVFNSGANTLVSQVKKVSEDANSFSQNVEVFRKTFFEHPNSTSQTVIAFDINEANGNSKDKFIEKMKSYIDKYPEAKTYEDEVLDYIDFCDITNRKRIEFTNIFLTILAYNEQISSLKLANSTLNTELISLGSKRISTATKIAVYNGYLEVKRFYLQLLYLQSKALDYYTLNKTKFTSDLFNSGIDALHQSYISGSRARLLAYYQNESYSRSQQSTHSPILINLDDSPIAYQNFLTGETSKLGERKAHRYNFEISPENHFFLPEGGQWAEIYITSARVFLDNVETDKGSISFDLLHLGDATFINSNRERVKFSHKPVKKNLTYNILSEDYIIQFDRITGNQKDPSSGNPIYVGISPFAHWSIIVDENAPSNYGLSLEKVTQIRIEFDFICTPFK